MSFISFRTAAIFLKRSLEPFTIFVAFIAPFALVPWNRLLETSDFVIYYSASMLMQHCSYGDIYGPYKILDLQRFLVPDSLHGYCYFYMAPMLSWIFFPLASISLKPAAYMWSIFGALLVALASMLLCWTCNINGMRRVWILVLIATTGPYLESIRLGQLSGFLLFGLVLILIGQKNNQNIPSIVGKSIFLLKPHLILTILAFELGLGRLRSVAITCLIALIGLSISIAFGGLQIIPSYASLIQNEWVEKSTLGFIYEPTFVGQLLKISVPFNIAKNIDMSLFFLLLLFAVFVGNRAKTAYLAKDTLFTVIVPLNLCLSSHLHNYDLLLLIPGLVLLSTYSLTALLARNALILEALTCFTFLLPVYVILHYFFVLKGSIINPFFWVVLLLALGSMHIEMHRRTAS